MNLRLFLFLLSVAEIILTLRQNHFTMQPTLVRISLFICSFLITSALTARENYWQQGIEYKMEIEMDTSNHRFSGSQEITYYNNSPDDLNEIYMHLFLNAFQPGSMMDVRSRTIDDPDRRVSDRIFNLSEEEIGYQKIKSLKINGKKADFNAYETIVKIELPSTLKSNKKLKIELEFEAQVPLQIRRTGRMNKEDVHYSMTQWYPKVCEYDYRGWHAYPYIGREFHGVWGDFDVKITIDSNYVVAATGTLQNPEQIGHGYLESGKKLKRPNGGKLTWHFKAKNVHDFAWGADPDFKHVTFQKEGAPLLRFFYKKNDEEIQENWEKLPEYTADAFIYMNEHFGKYPYEDYSVVQGGDGGMEYPMLTLITGRRSLGSLVGVTVHELIHSWYQGMLATNEALFPWMDEGFTTYASNVVMAELFPDSESDPHGGSYRSYFALVESGKEEPKTTHADHYQTNRAYGIASYSKGNIFLNQLNYILGEEMLHAGLKKYYDEWKFKHPEPNDFKRVLEKMTGIHLGWYFDHWIGTTNTIDYGIRSVIGVKDKTHVTIERIGNMMMPVEVFVMLTNGDVETYYFPLKIMFGEKEEEFEKAPRKLTDIWRWVDKEKTFVIPHKAENIAVIDIDSTGRMADVDESNNTIVIRELIQE